LASSYTVNLIWQIEALDAFPEKFHQRDWIREILEVVDGKYEIFMDKSIIICGGVGDKIEHYFAKLHDMKYKVGAIISSDEIYTESTNFYQYCAFVLRNYWHKKFLKPILNTRNIFRKKQPLAVVNTKIKFFLFGYEQVFWGDGMHPEIKRFLSGCTTGVLQGRLPKAPE
jgi:hypothetical protein